MGVSPGRLLAEPARPAWVRARPNAPYYALGAVCIGAFMGQLDASIVTVAFPTFERVFGATVGAVTWVGLSYLIVLVAGVTAVGRLADMVGRKLLYTYGFLIFIVGSGLCAVAPNLVTLDAFRVLQGLGAVMLQANSVAIIYLAMPPERLVRGIGIQGAAQALGLALGPTVGGFLLAAGGWRLIFLVNVPAGIIGSAAAWVFVPRSRELQARVRYDWPGLAMFIPAVAAVLVVVTFAKEWGWLTPASLVPLGAAVLLAVAFVRRERRVDTPMVEPSLFRRLAFTAGILSGMLSYLVLFGTMFAVPYFLERGSRVSASEAGLVLSALPLTLGVVAPFAGRLADHIEVRAVTMLGAALSAAGLFAAALLRPGVVLLAVLLAVVGAGQGLFTPANNAAIMASAPREHAGLASGVLNMTRGLGTSLGLALTGLLFGSVAGMSSTGVGGGFQRAGIFLGVMAGISAVLAGLRGRNDAAGPVDEVALASAAG